MISAGVFQPSLLRGRLLIRSTTRLSSLSETSAKEVLFGKNCRSKPFVFSFAVLFFAKIGLAYMDYRKHGQFKFTAPAILFACLVFTLTAPLYIWSIIGM